MKVASQILEYAKLNKVMITTAESCTGGMVMAALTEIAGASAVVDRGFVTYTNSAKMQMLGVQSETLEQYGAVSEEVAAEMAQGALANSDAQLAVSITGIAGPGGSEHKPEGRVCFGLSQDAGTLTQTIEFGALGRGNVRKEARDYALQMLCDHLLETQSKTR
jgi:nicotinamide-nucleotide amidase